MNKIVLFGILYFSFCPLMAQKSYMYRIYLKDKAQSAFSVKEPQKYLSQKAIERRTRQGLKIDATDLPVSSKYLEILHDSGLKIVTKSKWNNSVVVEVKDTSTINEIKNFPFVVRTKKVFTVPDSIPARNMNRKKEVINKYVDTDNYYGDAFRQIEVHHGDSLHAAGFRGEGIDIAVIDAGFYNADEIDLFKNMHLLGTKDFVNPKSDIYAENSHGMKVLSCMAANKPNVMVGTAPEANYWLLRSENNDSENPIEEDYWAAAVEFADSVGVDLINTSLGYNEFDDKSANYKYRDLDGHTSLMSNSASMLADKGIVLVNSAGNSGRGTWKKITPPADAENVITVGAMNRSLMNGEFSSVGDTADKRVKPDAMAVGVASAVASIEGTVSKGNGTSFASPILCGVVASFWQACPWLTAKQVVEAVQKAGDRYTYPDNIFGYGVPDMWKAYKIEKAKKENGRR